MSTYSFLNVAASIVGPGGNFSLGYGAATAKEGITVTMLEPKGKSDTGADGALMQTLRPSKLGRITVRLLKTSPVNAQLMNMYNLQSNASGLWGNNTIRVSDIARGDTFTMTQASFEKMPDVTYAEDGNTNEWSFTGNVEGNLGIGQAAIVA